MPLTKRMMAVGIPAESAKSINGSIRIYASVSTTVSQAAATPLTDDINMIINAQAAGAVLLPGDAVVSDTITVTNFTGSNVSIYGTSGEQVNAGGANNPLVLATGSTVQLTQINATNWYAT